MILSGSLPVEYDPGTAHKQMPGESWESSILHPGTRSVLRADASHTCTVIIMLSDQSRSGLGLKQAKGFQ
jgi:hypothetical protein